MNPRRFAYSCGTGAGIGARFRAWSMAGAAVGCSLAAMAAGTVWDAADGTWAEANHWSGGTPDATTAAEIRGHSRVLLGPGRFAAAQLDLGLRASDDASLEIAGGQLVLTQDSLRVGEYTGSRARCILRSGAVHSAMDIFIGAASSVPGRATHAELEIAGGALMGRTLTVGAGLGADTLLSVDGSAAEAIHLLDYCYLQGLPDGHGGGRCRAVFTLDEHGVTPISIQSRVDGLRIIRGSGGSCRLEVKLRAVPPRGNVTLVASHVPIRGEFDERPEGSLVTADFGGKTYRWRLSYRGGAAHHDLVLEDRNDYAAGAAPTTPRSLPVPPRPLWEAFRPSTDLPVPTQTAFDGAAGYGASAKGGRDGKRIEVVSLADAGAGTLRDALAQSGPREVGFRVEGTIALQSPLIIDEPFVTVDGSAAPGGGIMLRNHGIEVRTHDVVLRYLRIRVGDDDVKAARHPIEFYRGGEGDHALYFTGATDCIADHLSLSWSTSKMLSITKLSDRITIQWCLLGESLNFADHGFASIAGGSRVTWHHNLFAHHLSRVVRFQGMVDADFRNNVIYDWGHTAGYGEFDRLNYVGNYLKPGPSTTQRPVLAHTGAEGVSDGSLFLEGNVIETDPKATADNWRGFGYYYFDRERLAASGPFPAPRVPAESAPEAYAHVLADVGAVRPRRDATDDRIVREVREGSGHIVRSMAEVGGWPAFPSATGE